MPEAHFDIWVEWEVHHAVQLTVLNGLRTLEFTALTFVNLGDGDIAELRRARQCAAGISEQDNALLLLDLSMPMLGGREVLAAVRRSVGASDLNVVVVTDAPDPDTELEMLQAGADAYVRKPIEARSLMEQIEAVLRSPPSQTSPSNQECPVVK